MNKAVVLSSGGVDSTTCLGMAVDKLGAENVVAVSVFYGQKHSKELECAKKVCEHYGVKQYTLDLSSIFKFSNCPLLSNSDLDIIHESYSEQIDKNGEGKVDTYVPFRNGLMLSAVASLALSIFPNDKVSIYIGAHADDSAGNAYADCSPAFNNAISSSINLGTYNQVCIEAPLINLNKGQVVGVGLKLNVPYHLTWSCYEGRDNACGTCATCIDRKQAFIDNNTVDPIAYERQELGMYKVSKRMEIAVGHKLNLNYESKCQNLHGHNLIVHVKCCAEKLNENGMVVDFAKVKQAIHGKLDHGYLNAIFDFNPTAENLSKWICDEVTEMCVPHGICYEVSVQESEGNIATYSVL